MTIKAINKLTAISGDFDYYSISANDDNGNAAWYYVMVAKHKVNKFKTAIRESRVNLADVATILERGYGKPKISLSEWLYKNIPSAIV